MIVKQINQRYKGTMNKEKIRKLIEKEAGTGLTSNVKFKAMEQSGCNPY